MTCKVTFFFTQGATRSGWSETIWHNASDPAVAMSQARTLAVDRALCLSKDSNLVYIRASLVGSPRIVTISDYEGAPLSTGPWDGSEAWNGLLLRARDTNGKTRPWFFRDIPADLTDVEHGFAAVPGFSLALNTYRTDLLGAGGSWQIRSRQTVLVNPRRNILLITAAAENSDLVMQIPNHGFVANDVIAVSRIHSMPQWNSQWTVQAVTDANTIVATRSRKDYPPAAVSGEGFARKLAYSFASIVDLASERVVHRIVGRPFALPRGQRHRLF